MNPYLEQMEIIRELTRLSNKLRNQLGIKLSEELLDVAYGGTDPKKYYLLPKYRVELCKAIGIYDLGYDLASPDNYEHHNNLAEKPKGEHWKCIEEDGVYLCLNTRVPNWLKEKHEERKKHRELMQERKASGVQYDN